MVLPDANRTIGFHEVGVRQARKELEIYERLGDTRKQAECLIKLTPLLGSGEQFDAAEEAAFRAIALLPKEGQQFRVCQSHFALGDIYRSKGGVEEAIHHFEAILAISTPFNWHDFGPVANWRICFMMKAGSTMHRPTPSA